MKTVPETSSKSAHVSSPASSGKGARDENFPVASILMRAEHRPLVMAFYRFAREADDIADAPALAADEKLRRLDGYRAALEDGVAGPASALELRRQLARRSLSNRHPLDLLRAFRQDATQSRYGSWDDLIGYCEMSAAPVGRFVLDVHGENVTTWSLADPVCNALQIVNHLQDCGADRRSIDRVYLPAHMLAAAGASEDDLLKEQASPGLLACIRDCVSRTEALLDRGAPLPGAVADRRLGLEIDVTIRLARSLLRKLAVGDPLATRIKLRPWDLLVASGRSLAGLLVPARPLGGAPRRAP